MSEKFNHLSYSHVKATSRELLGENRLEPLSLFSNEEHLHRLLDGFKDNPDVTVTKSSIDGGTALIQKNRASIEAQLPETMPDRMPMISALHTFFRVGFGIVEGTIVNHKIQQADPNEITTDAYNTWREEQSQEDRSQEIAAYLKSQDADMLALNFLEDEKEGTILNFASSVLKITAPRVTGKVPYLVNAAEDSEARSQLKEGVLAALYLLREHHVGQSMRDSEEFFVSTEPPETPPGHYLG